MGVIVPAEGSGKEPRGDRRPREPALSEAEGAGGAKLRSILNTSMNDRHEISVILSKRGASRAQSKDLMLMRTGINTEGNSN
jgi:hypothetical protein